MSRDKTSGEPWREILNSTVLNDCIEKASDAIGIFNILVAGKSGVGKTTLINRVFGADVGLVGSGEPVTKEIIWYKWPDHNLRLCDTRGLELKGFRKTLSSLKQEIRRCASTGKTRDRIHAAWICIQENSARVEEGEKDLAELCSSHGIPVVVVLTKALGPKSFADDVRRRLPGASAVVRVLAADWEQPLVKSFGLKALVQATYKVAESTGADKAFVAAQQIDFSLKKKVARGLTFFSLDPPAPLPQFPFPE